MQIYHIFHLIATNKQTVHWQWNCKLLVSSSYIANPRIQNCNLVGIHMKSLQSGNLFKNQTRERYPIPCDEGMTISGSRNLTPFHVVSNLSRL
jgi:hypothetical protein